MRIYSYCQNLLPDIKKLSKRVISPANVETGDISSIYEHSGLWKIFRAMLPAHDTAQKISQQMLEMPRLENDLKKTQIHARFVQKQKELIKRALDKQKISLPEEIIDEYIEKYSCDSILKSLDIISSSQKYLSSTPGGLKDIIQNYSDNRGFFNRFSNLCKELGFSEKKLFRSIYFDDSKWDNLVESGEYTSFLDLFKKMGITDEEKIALLKKKQPHEIKWELQDLCKIAYQENSRKKNLLEILSKMQPPYNAISQDTQSRSIYFKNKNIMDEYRNFIFENFNNKNFSYIDVNTILATPMKEVKAAKAFIDSLPKEAQERWTIKNALLFSKYQKYDSLEQLPLDMKNQLLLDVVTATDWVTGQQLSKEIKILPKDIDEWVKVADYLKKEVQPVSDVLSKTESENVKKLFETVIMGKDKTEGIKNLLAKTRVSKDLDKTIKTISTIVQSDKFKTLPDSDKKILIIASILSDLKESALSSVHRAKCFEFTTEEFQKLYSVLKNQNLHENIEKIIKETPQKDIQIYKSSLSSITYQYNKIISELLQPNTLKMSSMLSEAKGKNIPDDIQKIAKTIEERIGNCVKTINKTHLEYDKYSIQDIKGKKIKVVNASDLKDFFGYVHTTEGEMGTTKGHNFCANPIFGEHLDNRMKVKLVDVFETITHNNIMSVGMINDTKKCKGVRFLIDVKDGNSLPAGATMRRLSKKDIINSYNIYDQTYSLSDYIPLKNASDPYNYEQLVSNPKIIGIITDNPEKISDEYVKLAEKLDIPVINSQK